MAASPAGGTGLPAEQPLLYAARMESMVAHRENPDPVAVGKLGEADGAFGLGARELRGGGREEQGEG